MAQRRKWNKKLILQEINNLKVRLGRRPAKRDNSNLYSLTRQYFGSWNNALKEAGFNIKPLQVPTLPRRLDEDLAYFLGLLITDGHIVYVRLNGRYKVMLFNSYSDESKVIISLIKKLFGYDAKINIRANIGFSKKPNNEIYITSKPVTEFLIKEMNIPSGAKSKSVRVPSKIFGGDKKVICAFVRGVIDGDGSIAKSHIKIASGSIGFLKDMKALLEKINVSSGKINKEKNSGTFIIYLSSMDNLARLRSLVYSSSDYFYPRKKRSWEGLKNNLE